MKDINPFEKRNIHTHKTSLNSCQEEIEGYKTRLKIAFRAKANQELKAGRNLMVLSLDNFIELVNKVK